jgi:hypothetical protein
MSQVAADMLDEVELKMRMKGCEVEKKREHGEIDLGSSW